MYLLTISPLCSFKNIYGIKNLFVIITIAYDAGQDSSIDTVESRQAFTVTSLGNGVYALAEQADDICVYDLAGRLVIRTSGSTVDLSAKASGLYILCADGHSAKIIR